MLKNDYTAQKRTKTQNDSLHLGLEIVARECQEKGITMNAILERARAEVDVTQQGLKYNVFHPIMKAMYHIDSTTKLAKIGQIDNVWDKMMHFLGKEFELEYIPFPHNEHGDVDEEGRVTLKDDQYI